MDENKIKMIYESHCPDKEQIRENVLSAARAEEKPTRKFKFKPIIAACAAMFLVVVGLGGYALKVEAAEYRQAVEFFDEYNLSTEGYTRSEIKAVYRDITEKTYSYEKTIEILNNISVEMYQTQLGTLDKDALDSLWNVRNSIAFGNNNKKDGVHYMAEYDGERSVIIKYDGKTELWRYEIPYDMYVFAGANFLECEDGLIVYGEKGFISSTSENYAVAFMLDNSGKLLWTYNNSIPRSEFQAVVRHGDEIALIGVTSGYNLLSSYLDNTQRYYTIFVMLDKDGNVTENRIFENNDYLRYDAIVRVGDSYLVKRRVRGNDYSFEPELVSLSLSGELTDKFTYSEGGVTYEIQDIIHYGGKVYLSAVLPNITNSEFRKEFGKLYDEFMPKWEKNQDVKMSDSYNKRLNDLFITQYSAVLLVCDEDAKITKAYSVENARVGTLTVTDDGKLSWQVIRIDDVHNVSPYISSRIVDIAATEFAFTFGEDGHLYEKREVGAYSLMY